MNPKKSGLADSPLFRAPSPPPPVVQDIPIVQPPDVSEDLQPVNTSVPVFGGEPEGEQANGRTPAHPNARTGEHANRRTPERANGRTRERRIVRQSYNIYQDQHEALKRIEAKSALSGKTPLNISQMVRQALDDYLSKQ